MSERIRDILLELYEVVVSFNILIILLLKKYLNDVVCLNLSDKYLIPSVYCNKDTFAYKEQELVENQVCSKNEHTANDNKTQ